MLKFIFYLFLLFFPLNIYSKDLNTIILATTTSVYDTGLLDVILLVFEKKTGLKVKAIAIGTGQALSMAARGEVDILLTHSPEEEKKFINQGYGINRKLVMHNYFILAGPESDPANLKQATTISAALKRIAETKANFVSRGDNSGTHIKEKYLWEKAEIVPDKKWYIESGTGMATTLQIANQKNAYLLSDISTFLALEKNLSLKILFKNDKDLLNKYHIMEVNPAPSGGAKFKDVNHEGAKAFSNFFLS
ncbi:MAG: substrate-binding domain-containing protein [Candidatus Firestonebacteria bacterium]